MLISATNRRMRRRLLMVLFLAMLGLHVARNVRDAELSFEPGQFLEIDRADDVYDGELPGFCRDDEKSGDGVAVHLGVDVDILFRSAGDLDDLLPRGAELRADPLSNCFVVLPFMLELVAADVDAGETVDHLLRRGFIGVGAGEKLAGKAKPRSVEGDVDRLAGLGGELRKLHVDARRLRLSRKRKRRAGDDGEKKAEKKFGCVHGGFL